MAVTLKNHSTMPLSVFLIIAVVAGFSSCGILSSDEPPELEPGPRNYEWTVDSVYSAPGGWMNTIWGSSPDDVWIGSSGGYEKLWHFDGEEYSPYAHRFVGDFYSIFGFAQDDVWMGGGDGELWHFDGQEWELSFTYSPEGFGGPNIFDIWGTSSSDIYAVGTVSPGSGQEGSYKGFILHFDGNQWQEMIMTDFGMQFQRIRKNNEGIYLYGFGPYSTHSTSDSISFYKYKNDNLLELYSYSISNVGSPNMNLVGGKIYIISKTEVVDINFNSILLLSITEDVYDVNGRHKKDMFITTESGVLHYNGENTQYLFELENKNATVFRSLVLENDVFFLINDYEAGTNLIYHGTLTKSEKEDE